VPQPVLEEVLRAHARRSPGVDLRLGHSVRAFAQDHDGVTVTVLGADSASYQMRARYVLGCDGSAGVVRKQLGVRYLGRSDARANFNVVFRAPSLEPALGPAVQYWVVGDGTTGLIGRLDLHGTWWAIFAGVEHDYGTARGSRADRRHGGDEHARPRR
jgi:2-polyprenyl-6-methoxyphenol hydroxylase-like FAD-dependent oxidoreductase